MEFLPLWVAPNVITLAGFLLISANFAAIAVRSAACLRLLISCAVLLLDSHSLLVPRLDFHLLCCLYHGLPDAGYLPRCCCHRSPRTDNIDGKQARRTKSSSALGELFDHGCDSLFVTVRACATTCTEADSDRRRGAARRLRRLALVRLRDAAHRLSGFLLRSLVRLRTAPPLC